MKVNALDAKGGGRPPTEHRWSELGVHTWVRMAIIGGLFIYLFRLELYRLVTRWLTDPSWSHGFLIPIFSCYFLNQRRQEILSLQARPHYGGLGLLLASLIFYFFNLLSPAGYAYFRSLTLVVALAAVVWFLGGTSLLRVTWLPVLFLFFAVPLPRRLYVSLTLPMRSLAATVAAALLNLVPHVETSVRGVVIDILYHGRPVDPALNVAEACSGMRLLMAFLALGVAMATLQVRPLWQRLVLLAASIPIAIFCNIVRVTLTGFLYVLVHPRYTQGIYHDLLGLAMLPLAFGCYGFLAWFLSSLFMEDQDGTERDVVQRTVSHEQ